MTGTHSSRRRRLIAASALAAVCVALLAAMALAARPGARAEQEAGAGCSKAGEPAAELTAKELRKAVRCLINAERSDRDLAELRRDRRLKRVAQKHGEVMVESGCLAHRCAGEAELEDRLHDSGYLDGAELWRFAENTGCATSAQAMVDNWMKTRFHRVNIVEPKFSELGVGAVKERVKPRCERGFATFAVVFAWRDAGPASG